MQRHRSVIKRYERLRVLKEKGSWNETQGVLGLPKVKIIKIKVKKEKAKAEGTAEKGAAATAAGTPAAAAAPPTGKPPAKAADVKSALPVPAPRREPAKAGPYSVPFSL